MNDTIRGDKRSKWIDNEDMAGEGLSTYKCSYCGFVLQLMEGASEDNLYNYCPR